MFNLKLEEKVNLARLEVESSTSENIIERCQNYLKMLDSYRDEMYKYRGNPEINRQQKSLLSPEAVDGLRKQIRHAVEKTTREHNRIEDLLKSFTAISGYDALETFNRCHYKGFSNWQLKAGGSRFGGGAEADKISIQDAVATASLLRRAEYLNLQTITVN